MYPVAFLAAAIAAPAASPAGPAGWFACDAVDGPLVAIVGRPDGRGVASIVTVDRRNGRTEARSFVVAPADHGAGQVHWPLSRQGREVGSIHGINPGMVAGSGADALPPIKGITIGASSLACRWQGDTRLLAIGRTRTVQVSVEGGRTVYRSFDFARRGPAIDGAEGVVTTRPTLTIVGGTRSTAGDWRFVNAGYVFMVSTRAGRGPARVTVTRGGKVVGVTDFLTFTDVR